MRYINIYKDALGEEFSDDTPHKSYDDALLAALNVIGEYVATYTDSGVIYFSNKDRESYIEAAVAEQDCVRRESFSDMLWEALKPLPNRGRFMPTNPTNVDLGE